MQPDPSPVTPSSQPPVRPVLEFQVSAGPGGGFSPVSASFSPSSDTVIIQYPVKTTPPHYWWRFHGPDVAAAVALLSALLIFFLSCRVLRRRQSPERLYCTQCNYDLTPAEAPAAPIAACPECGTQTAKKPPAPGRPALFRLLPLLGLLVPAFLISAGMFVTGIESKTPGNDAWPLETLGQIPWWPLARHTIPFVQSRIFETYSLPEGTKVHTSTIAIDPWEGRFTRDLRYYTYSQMNEENGWNNLAVVFDPATGQSRSYNMGNSGTGFSKFHGYTPDETEAVFTHISLVDGAGKCAARILCLNLQTLKMREVATVQVAPQSISPNSWQLPSLAAAVCNSPPKWAFTPMSGPTSGQLDFGTFGPDASRSQSTLATAPATSMTGAAALSYTSAGELILNESLEVIPETGAVRARPSPPPTVSASITNGVLSINRGNTLGAQSIPVDPSFSYLSAPPKLSPDGRWMLIEVFVTKPAPQPPTMKCLIFDVSKAKLPSPQR